jgi:signal recognition particle GTPase
MDSSQNPKHVPPSESFGTVPNVTAPFGKVPLNAEAVGSVPNTAEDFRTMPVSSESREQHTLSVREVSRMFEAAGVARSERSIVNWCQSNAQGIGKLDAYFDPNERKYFITLESAERAIQEEKAKVAKHVAERFGTVPNVEEMTEPANTHESPVDGGRVKELEAELMDSKIANRAKDQVIKFLREDQQAMLTQLTSSERLVGELETKLLQIESPVRSRTDDAQLGG